MITVKMIRVQKFLGGEIIFEQWLNAMSENDMRWLEFSKGDTETAMHPELTMLVSTFELVDSYHVKPTNPARLEDIV